MNSCCVLDFSLEWHLPCLARVSRIGLNRGSVLLRRMLSVVGGLLASGLLAAPDIGSVTSWRKIFLVEGLCTPIWCAFSTDIHSHAVGIITAGIGILCIFIIPADPQKTRLLSEPERQLALARIAADHVARNNGKKEKTTLKLIMRAFNFNVGVFIIEVKILIDFGVVL